MPSRSLVALLLLGCLAGCGEGAERTDEPRNERSSTSTPSSPSGSPQDATEKPSSTPGGAGDGTRIVVDDSEFGTMLFDGKGQAIYLFDVETSPEPRCYGACAAAWPPVLAEGEPVAGAGVDAALLGTTERTDGTQQVTYGGHPLYFYAHEDTGEVKCHDVFLNGGNWYVVQPDGDAAPPG